MGSAAEAPEASLDAEAKRLGMKDFRWFHSIDLGDGVVTPGMKSAQRLAFQAKRVFRHPIAGQSLLDIGCWDGYFAFEARRRGASRVLAADHHVWHKSWGDKAAFEFARRCLDPAVEVRDIAFNAMTPESVGTFDVVLFLGVLHHMRHPLAALERAASMTRRMLVVETHIDTRLAPEPPAMTFYPFREFNNDAGTWWGPNPAGVVAMLQACGFSKVEHDMAYLEGGGAHALVHAIR